MKVVRVPRQFWPHPFYVSPENWRERLVLMRRGYRCLPEWSLLGWRGWWALKKC